MGFLGFSISLFILIIHKGNCFSSKLLFFQNRSQIDLQLPFSSKLLFFQNRGQIASSYQLVPTYRTVLRTVRYGVPTYPYRTDVFGSSGSVVDAGLTGLFSCHRVSSPVLCLCLSSISACARLGCPVCISLFAGFTDPSGLLPLEIDTTC